MCVLACQGGDKYLEVNGSHEPNGKAISGLQDQCATLVTVRRAVKSADEHFLSNCWLQFWHKRVTGHCYAVEEGTGQHKVNVSLGLKCAHLPDSTEILIKISAGRRKKLQYLLKTSTLSQ